MAFSGSVRSTYDYIIVGAGPAGCAAAARLSLLPGCRVLLIEAGGSDRHPLLSVPVATMLTMRHPRYTWRFRTEPEAALEGRSPSWYGGRLLGGGSAINGMMYLRGHPRDYDRWRDTAGCAGWGFADMLPFFQRAESSDRGPDAWHGGTGPVAITRGTADFPIASAFLDMIAAAGLPIVDDLNADAAEGFGYYDRAIGGGRRSSAGGAYLRGLADRRALTVLTGARAVGLSGGGARIDGVRFVYRGKLHEARADAEVVLAAGCINTAQLLLLAGIGPADALSRHGIAVRANSPDVGLNVQNHIAYTLQYALAAPITAYEYRHPARAAAAFAQYALQRRGMLAGLLCPAGGLFRADPLSEIADTQVILGAGLPGAGSGWRGLLPTARGFTLMINQGRPWSRGSIALRSADPEAPPLIRSGHFSDHRDLELLTIATTAMRALLRNHRIAGEIATEIGAGAQIIGHAALAEHIRQHAQSYYHMAGSCRMGSDDDAVVDTALRVRGVDGLRIADTSVAPLLVNGNTTAMALMLGERAAELIASGA